MLILSPTKQRKKKRKCYIFRVLIVLILSALFFFLSFFKLKRKWNSLQLQQPSQKSALSRNVQASIHTTKWETVIMFASALGSKTKKSERADERRCKGPPDYVAALDLEAFTEH